MFVSGRMCGLSVTNDFIFFRIMKKIWIFISFLAFVCSCSQSGSSDRDSEDEAAEGDSVYSDTVAIDDDGGVYYFDEGYEDEYEEYGEVALASSFPQKDAQNHAFVKVADVIWRYGQDENPDVYNYANQKRWQQECEKALVDCYDANHGESTLSKDQKAEAMLDEIARFFDEDSDETNMGMIVSADLQNQFLRYRIAAATCRLETRYPDLIKEISAWNNLHKCLDNFTSCVSQLEWFGGSGVGLAVLTAHQSLLENRLNDLKRIEQNAGGSANMKLVRQQMQSVVDKVAASITSPEEAEEYLLDGQIQEYQRLYTSVHKSKESLKVSFGKWVDVREKLLKTSVGGRIAAATPIFSEKLATTIHNCLMD